MHLAIFLENFLIFFNFYFKFENTSHSPLIRFFWFNDRFSVEPDRYTGRTDRYTDLNRLNKYFELRFEFLRFPPAPGRIEQVSRILVPVAWLISHQYFSLRTNQPPTTSQQYFFLRTNQHQPSGTSQPNRLMKNPGYTTHCCFTRDWQVEGQYGAAVTVETGRRIIGVRRTTTDRDRSVRRPSTYRQPVLWRRGGRQRSAHCWSRALSHCERGNEAASAPSPEHGGA
jgi:hypothetical protein